jgi:hypothetical protein
VVSFDNSTLENLVDGVLSLADLADFRITIDPDQHRIVLASRDKGQKQIAPSADNRAESAVEFRMMGNLILLPVSLNDHEKGNFLFDSGALMSALSSKQAKLLGALEENASTKSEMQFAGACGVTQSVLPVKDITLKLKELKKDYPQILALDMSEICKELQTEIQGILGVDFFGNKKITIDYEAATLTLE